MPNPDPRFLGRKAGRPGERRAHKPKRILTEAQKAALTARLRTPGGDNEHIKAARARQKEELESLQSEFQTCDIITFTTKFLKMSLDGYPFLELVLRCSEGLPLPAGTVQTFVEVPSDGFAVQEVELTWPEYFALCSVGAKTYQAGKVPSTIGARVGRRGGKSTAATIKALFVGTRARYRPYVRPNELLEVPILATSEDQAQAIIKQRCHEVLKQAQLDWLIGGLDPKLHNNLVTNDTLPLITGAEIQSFPCNSKKVRGHPAPLVALDEYAHFAIEGRKKDKDIRAAATGAQSQFPGYQLWMISTPLVEEGDFFDTEQQAKAGDAAILFFHCPSWTAAPVLYRNNPDFYHNEFRRDPDRFTLEFRAEYGTSREPAFREEDIVGCQVLAGELPFHPSCRYGAGIDQSGLAGNDRFSLVVAGFDPARDVCFEACRQSWSISDLDTIMANVRQTLQRYRVYKVATDRYAKNYVAQALAKEGIESSVAPPTADLCIQFRQLLVGRKMELPMALSVKMGLEQTNMVLTDKARTPTVWHPRTKAGHGDEVDARFRAVHEAVTSSWEKGRTTEQERQASARQKQQEESYDPLTYGRN